MTMYTFLSPEWREAAQPIRDRFAASDSPHTDLVANVTVTNVPFSDGPLELHSAAGIPNVLDPGHVTHAVAHVTLSWGVARLSLLDDSNYVLRQGIDSGEIEFSGDTTEVAAFWRTHIGDGDYVQLLADLRAITK